MPSFPVLGAPSSGTCTLDGAPAERYPEERLEETPALLSALKREIERALRWLNAKVLVTSRSFAEQTPLPGLSVTSLPRPS